MDESDNRARERVLRFLSEASGRSPASIGLREALIAFDIDSLENVEFIMEVEDEFGVEIPDSLVPLVTVADLIDFVHSALK